MSTIAGRVKLDEAAFRELEGSFNGELVRPGEGSYEQHRRIWNGSIDRTPALIARCVEAGDVAAALGFAKRTGL
ncbi:MAG TPA: hypothetical protein VE889_03770, partial [Actinomycetota bacterium]|nr:hypothetical protein [Actinomycetota bacterium]